MRIVPVTIDYNLVITIDLWYLITISIVTGAFGFNSRILQVGCRAWTFPSESESYWGASHCMGPWDPELSPGYGSLEIHQHRVIFSASNVGPSEKK